MPNWWMQGESSPFITWSFACYRKYLTRCTGGGNITWQRTQPHPSSIDRTQSQDLRGLLFAYYSCVGEDERRSRLMQSWMMPQMSHFSMRKWLELLKQSYQTAKVHVLNNSVETSQAMPLIVTIESVNRRLTKEIEVKTCPHSLTRSYEVENWRASKVRWPHLAQCDHLVQRRMDWWTCWLGSILLICITHLLIFLEMWVNRLLDWDPWW